MPANSPFKLIPGNEKNRGLTAEYIPTSDLPGFDDSELFPKEVGEQIKAEKEAEKNRSKAEQSRPRGRLATLFTSPSGLLDDPKTSRRSLIGY